MALATTHNQLQQQQQQGSCTTFPSVPPSCWSRGTRLKHFVPTLRAFGRKERFSPLKCKSSPSVGVSLVGGANTKVFKISAFKGGSRHDDSVAGTNGSKPLMNTVKVSYLQHQSEESSNESSKVQNGVPRPYTPADEATTSSLAIKKLFYNWLMLLRTPSQSQPVEQVLEEPSSNKTSEMPKVVQRQDRGGVLKAVWCRLLSMDATIKIPLLIFAPLYLGVNLIYGSEVSKELIPLWILGPITVALYLKMFQAICGLYAFSFKQTVKVIKNLPSHYSLIHNYVTHGKLKEAIETHIWQPLANMKSMDYKEVSWRIMKGFQGWLLERYLDFIELIWPYYCRTIRFLKRANFI